MGSLVTLDSFDHTGVVVKDAEATAESWTQKLGAGPWRFTDAGALKLAHAQVGGIQYELLEPLEDQSLWAKFLAAQGEGLHHICHMVADVDDAVEKLKADGGTVMIAIPKAMAYVEIGGPGSVIIELLKTR
ncbi:MAG: VOC family protein [Desulfobacterales bacterium]